MVGVSNDTESTANIRDSPLAVNEAEYLTAEADVFLRSAERAAKKGDRSFMHYCLKEASEYAKKAGILNEPFYLARVSQVHEALAGDEEEERVTTEGVSVRPNSPDRAATKANRSSTMDNRHLKKEWVKYSKKTDDAFLAVVAKVRDVLGSREERYLIALANVYLGFALLAARTATGRSWMDSNLKQALRYAKKANFTDDVFLGKVSRVTKVRDVLGDGSEYHSTDANKNLAFLAKVAKVRNQLGDEADYHTVKANEKLNSAASYAMKGNRQMMNYCLGDAVEHATKASILNGAFLAKVAKVRNQLGDEANYHTVTSNEKLNSAASYAMKGNRQMMNYCLDDAVKHATKASIVNGAFLAKVAKVREGLGE